MLPLPACLQCNKVYFEPIALRLLPHLLSAQHHPDPETAALVKYVALQLSWAAWPSASHSAVLAAVKEISASPSWHVRASALKFLSVFLPRHALLLQGGKCVKQALKLCKALLQDEQLQVRLAASSALISLLSACPLDAEAERKLQKSFSKLARAKLLKAPKGKAAKEEGGKEAKEAATKSLAKRHAGVLGLSAFVTCHPYDVPANLPSILQYLAITHVKVTYTLSTLQAH